MDQLGTVHGYRAFSHHLLAGGEKNINNAAIFHPNARPFSTSRKQNRISFNRETLDRAETKIPPDIVFSIFFFSFFFLPDEIRRSLNCSSDGTLIDGKVTREIVSGERKVTLRSIRGYGGPDSFRKLRTVARKFPPCNFTFFPRYV